MKKQFMEIKLLLIIQPQLTEINLKEEGKGVKIELGKIFLKGFDEQLIGVKKMTQKH